MGGLEASRAVLELKNAFFGVLPEYRKIKKNLIIMDDQFFSGPNTVVTVHNVLWAVCWLMRPLRFFFEVFDFFEILGLF